MDFDRRVWLEFRGAQLSSDGGLRVMRELNDALGLSDLAFSALSEDQMVRLRPFFPKSRGKPRVDDRRVLSGIIFINRNGVRRWDAPADYGPENGSAKVCHGSGGIISTCWGRLGFIFTMIGQYKRVQFWSTSGQPVNTILGTSRAVSIL
jgi:hypothetical protein